MLQAPTQEWYKEYYMAESRGKGAQGAPLPPPPPTTIFAKIFIFSS